MSDNRETPSPFRDALQKKVESTGKDAGGARPEGAGRVESSAIGAAVGEILEQPIALFGPNLTDMAIFCRQLAMLLDVGIPLVRSLRILSERSEHPRLKKVAGQVARDVEEGERLSEAFAKHPRVFPALLVNVARIGEAGGILEGSLNRLADTMEQKMQIRKKIVSACMYPAAAVVVAVAVLLVILIKAIPVFAKVYEDMPHAELPDITQNVISLSNFAQSYYLIYIPAAIVVLIALWLFGATPMGATIYDWLRLNLPILGGINTKINVARFSRSLGNLLAAGIPLLESLTIISRTSENRIVGAAVGQARDNVERGGKMDEPLRRSRVFPPMVVDMMAIGDEAGALDTMLLKIADIYDADVDMSLKGLTALIEPILIVFLGVVVILIALAVLLPYFNLVSVVGVE